MGAKGLVGVVIALLLFYSSFSEVPWRLPPGSLLLPRENIPKILLDFFLDSSSPGSVPVMPLEETDAALPTPRDF